MSENTIIDAPFIPDPPDAVDWTALADNGVRVNHELPWLRYLRDYATEMALHDKPPGRIYWLGVRDGMARAIDYPMQKVMDAAREEAEAVEYRRKVEENASRRPTGLGYLRRLNPAYWRGQPSGKR